jgi:Tol biopolymer transport system component
LTSGPIQWGAPIPGKDGKTIFASGVTMHGELIRLDPRTKQFQPYLGGLSADNVSFSQDGQSIAYVSYPEGILWKANRDGSDRVQLSSAPVEPSMARWSPDGSQILFFDSSYEGRPVAFIVSSKGGAPQRLLPEDTGPQSDPNWSPDGRQVVFSTSPSGGSDPNSVIRILDLDSHRVSTVPGSLGLFAPRWSPDGRSIAAVPANSTNLYIFDIKTQQWSVPYKGVVAYPAWSKDGHSIYFMDFREDSGVFRVHLPDGAVEHIVDLKSLHYTGNSSMWMGMDPTDAPLFLRDLGSQDVYALALDRK